MKELHLPIYRCYRYCVLRYVVVRNIPSSIVFEIPCIVSIYYFLVCTCTLYCIIPKTYKREACTTVCLSAYIYVLYGYRGYIFIFLILNWFAFALLDVDISMWPADVSIL